MRYRGTAAELHARIRQLPLMLSGKLPDDSGAVKELLERIGAALLEKIAEAYDQKADGGTDAMGVTWPPLKERTFRERPRQGRLAAARHFAERLQKLNAKRGTMGLYEYRTSRQKLVDEYRGAVRSVGQAAAAGKYRRILILTRRMRNSLNPGDPENILRAGPGYVEIGSSTPYFKFHNSDGPREKNLDGTDRLPRRQVLPDMAPAAWREVVDRTLREGLEDEAFWRRFLGAKAA